MRQNNDTQSSVSLGKFVVQNNDMRAVMLSIIFFPSTHHFYEQISTTIVINKQQQLNEVLPSMLHILRPL